MTERSSPPRVFAVIAGGGTGGHVVPALAIGRALVSRGYRPEEIHFVGSSRGIERRLVPAAGFPLTLLPGRGIVRRLAWSNVRAVGGIVLAAGQAAGLLRQLRPSVVVAVGGYASVPCVLAAALWRVPVVVAEQNSVPGAANRLASRLGAVAAVSFPDTPLPRATVTGNPVRPEILATDRSPAGRAAARSALGLPAEGLVVGVATGSLGARKVNRAVLALAERWSDRGGVAIYHVTGERDWEALRADAPAAASAPGGLVYRQVRFEDRIDLLYAAADVMVGRAGASTVAELAVVGLPSVDVPLPGAPGDHQTANGRRLEAVGAAVVLPDAECDADHLAAALEPLLADPARRQAMGAAARRIGRPDAADAVAALVEAHARPSAGAAGARPGASGPGTGPGGHGGGTGG